jgi:hypothetical protein
MRFQKHPIAAFVVILSLLLLCVRPRAAGFASQHHADGPATHHMVVIGERTVYLWHLPMFQDPEDLKKQPAQTMPHRYQAILEVTFNSQDKYVKHRQEAWSGGQALHDGPHRICVTRPTYQQNRDVSPLALSKQKSVVVT